KAHIYHWEHLRANHDQNSGVLESEKAPLESRIWYSYPGQDTTDVLSLTTAGTSDRWMRVARVLDDGSTQLYQYEYNPIGKKSRVVDPTGRATIFAYDPSGIDLLEVRQVNGQATDLLRRYTYNTQHRILTSTDAAGQTTNSTYLPDGRLQT